MERLERYYVCVRLPPLSRYASRGRDRGEHLQDGLLSLFDVSRCFDAFSGLLGVVVVFEFWRPYWNVDGSASVAGMRFTGD